MKASVVSKSIQKGGGGGGGGGVVLVERQGG